MTSDDIQRLLHGVPGQLLVVRANAAFTIATRAPASQTRDNRARMAAHSSAAV